MPDFTFPLRPVSTSKRLVRRDAKSNLRAATAVATEPNNAEQALKSRELHSQLRPINHDPVRGLRHAMSHSQLGPVSTNKVLKPALRKKNSRADLKDPPQALTAEVQQDRSSEAEQTAIEEGFALIEEHMKDKATMKEMVDSMRNTRLKPRQSAPLLRMAVKDETIQDTLTKLTPRDVPINTYLVLSFQALEAHGTPLASSITILADDLSTLTALSAELQVEHSSTIGTILLRSKEPSQWLFQSRSVVGVESGSTSHASEFSRACSGEDAEKAYEGFAARAIEATKQRQLRVQKMRKRVAEYTVEGIRREFPEVRVPDAVNVFGECDDTLLISQ